MSPHRSSPTPASWDAGLTIIKKQKDKTKPLQEDLQGTKLYFRREKEGEISLCPQVTHSLVHGLKIIQVPNSASQEAGAEGITSL